jgi:hypothetical protein
MADAKHTPGEWHVNEFDDLEGDHHITVVFKENGCPVAHLYENGHQTRPNARLIAAAPELYESLDSVLWAIDKQPDHMEDAIRHARAAIAKALGEDRHG